MHEQSNLNGWVGLVSGVFMAFVNELKGVIALNVPYLIDAGHWLHLMDWKAIVDKGVTALVVAIFGGAGGVLGKMFITFVARILRRLWCRLLKKTVA